MVKFSARDPTAAELAEFKALEGTPLWREWSRDFSKWADAHQEARYNGDEDISRWCLRGAQRCELVF